MWPIKLLLCAILLAQSPRGTPALQDGIVALIEDEIMTWQELLEKAQPYFEGAQGEGGLTPAERRKILKEVLNVEIGEKMVQREIRAHRDSLQIGEQDIDRAIEDVLRTNHLTQEQLRAALFNQGMTWQAYRTNIRHQMERARLLQSKVQGKINITQERLQERCKERQVAEQSLQVCLSHLLVAVPSLGAEPLWQAGLAKIKQWRAEILAGADFPTFAYNHSDDKQRPDGALGCFTPQEMLEEFAQAIDHLEPGALSEPVRTAQGFHILRLDGRRVASGQPCENLVNLEAYRAELMQEEMQRQMDLWIQDLRKKAFVEEKLASFATYWQES